MVLPSGTKSSPIPDEKTRKRRGTMQNAYGQRKAGQSLHTRQVTLVASTMYRRFDYAAESNLSTRRSESSMNRICSDDGELEGGLCTC